MVRLTQQRIKKNEKLRVQSALGARIWWLVWFVLPGSGWIKAASSFDRWLYVALCFMVFKAVLAKLQNTPQLICISLNNNS